MWLTGMPPYASMMGHGGVPQEIQQLQLLRQQQLAQQQLAVVQQQQAHAQQMYKMWLAQHGPSEARARSELESTAATLSSMGAGRGQGSSGAAGGAAAAASAQPRGVGRFHGAAFPGAAASLAAGGVGGPMPLQFAAMLQHMGAPAALAAPASGDFRFGAHRPGSPTHAAASGHGNTGLRLASTGAETFRKRKRASQACLRCRRRKQRCSGSSPCDLCERAGVACEFTVGTDRRRRRRTASAGGAEDHTEGEKTSGYTSANDRSDVSGDEGDDVAAATLGNAVDNFVLPVVDHALLPRSVMDTNPASAHIPEGSTPGVAALCAATRATVLARDRSTAASTASFRAARKHMTRVLASDKGRDVGVEAAVFAAAQLVSYAVDVLRDPVLAAGFATAAVALLERLPGRATPLALFVVAYAAQRSPAGAAALPESLRDKPCAVVGRVVGRCVVSLISAMSTSSPPDSLFDWLTEVGDDDDAVLEVVEAQVGLARALAQYNIPTMSLLHAALAVRAWRGGDGTTAKRHADKALRISWALIDAPSAITSLPLAAFGSACASVIDKSRGASPRTDSQKTMLSTIRRHVQATALKYKRAHHIDSLLGMLLGRAAPSTSARAGWSQSHSPLDDVQSPPSDDPDAACDADDAEEEEEKNLHHIVQRAAAGHAPGGANTMASQPLPSRAIDSGAASASGYASAPASSRGQSPY